MGQAVELKGAGPALLTPFDEDGNVAFDKIPPLVERLIEKGVYGFFVCGATGEGMLLTTEERKKVLETVVKAADSKCWVIAHVGAMTTREACDLARHASGCGVDAVSSMPPLLYAVGEGGIERHYRAIAEAAGVPVVVYNIPTMTGVTVQLPLVERLAKIPGVDGMKYSTTNMYDLTCFSRVRGGEFFVFMGGEHVALSALVAGACGVIGSFMNFAPEPLVGIYESFIAGDIDRARELQLQVVRLVKAVLPFGEIASIKALVSRQGIEMGSPRLPIPPISEENQAAMYQAVDALDSEK